MSEIVIPEIDPAAGSLEAAFKYAAAGVYVLPTRSSGDAKHAGSVLGNDWPTKSSRDPQQIAAWFAASNHRVAVHCGRSGLIVSDVDHPDKLTPELRRAIDELAPPFHSTRPDEPGRGHYLFAQPPGRRLGNRAGETGKTWGEWRGMNGIILVGGPGRRWLRAGPVPVLPDYVARLLPDVGDAASAVSDDEIHRFVEQHKHALRPQSLESIVAGFRAEVDAGGSRHNAAVAAACWAVREAIEGRFSANDALLRLEDEFCRVMESGRDGNPVGREQAKAEFLSIVGWAVGQEWRPDGMESATEPHEDPTASLRERARALAVADALESRRIRGEADRLYALEGVTPPPPVGSVLLTDLLAEDDEPDSYRIDGVWPTDGKIVLTAPQKAGKTTLMGNLVASLADCTPFLGAAPGFPGAAGFTVEPLEAGRTVVVLDFEMTRRKLRAWLRAHGIRKTDAVRVELLRGVTWDPRDPRKRKEWTDHLRSVGCEVLIVDPLGPILHALNVNEIDNTEVGRVLNALDALVREAGIRELMVVHHMGHSGERSRGASVLRGWPDAEWRLLLEDWPGRDKGKEPPPGVARFFAATGRDVAVGERDLQFDPETRHLSIGDGTRTTHAVDKHAGTLAGLVAAEPGITKRNLREALKGTGHLSADAAYAVIKAGVGAGIVHVHRGANRAENHYPGPASKECTACWDAGDFESL